jgi:hypothetical protein
MDEFTFRRRIIAEPSDSSPDVMAACQEDKNKAQFKQEMEDFDKLLARSLDISVPDKLEEKILLGQSLQYHHKQKRKQRAHLAIAASFAFALGISFSLFNKEQQYFDTGQHALAHLQDELSHIPETADYTQAQLNAKLAQFGGEMRTIAPVSFANFCDFDGIKSLHIVMKTPSGDVTIFVVPKHSNLRTEPQFANERYQGQSREYRNANVMVVTNYETSISDWSNKVNEAIKWQKI